jgi:hypothetical protein
MKTLTYVLVFCFVLYLYQQYNDNSKYTKVGDNGRNTVHILDTENMSSVFLLDELGTRGEKLVNHVYIKYPDHEGAKLLRKRYNQNNLYEGSPFDENFTYTDNKGERIVICLKDKEMNYHDINLLMFPFIHELGHLCDKDHNPGHGPSFSKCFKWLLEEAIMIGVYTPIDFNSSPESYCGMTIDATPI